MRDGRKKRGLVMNNTLLSLYYDRVQIFMYCIYSLHSFYAPNTLILYLDVLCTISLAKTL